MLDDGVMYESLRCAAEMLDASSDVGNITPVAYADLIAIDSNPLHNIHLLHDVPFVMKNGEVVKERRVRAMTTK
jgi:imidazolonepropionase-like amidohydrolase